MARVRSQIDKDVVPLVSVGARNPNGRSDALFSNAGPWVRKYVRGAAVMSTIPPYDGGLLSMAQTEAYDRKRSGIDPDDFRGGFAVWSGTSFAAPFFAGQLAAELLPHLPKGSGPNTGAAVERGWNAVEALTEITR